MARWLGIALLLVGVAGAVAQPRRVPAWAVPALAAALDILLGVISLSRAEHALRALLSSVGFLLCAVPMSVMLDRLGLFSAVAGRLSRSSGRGALWALAALVTTFLNLDASVVLLTPLYVSVARRQGEDPLNLGVQPVLLACLASSALPVSNLTNLIAASWTGAGTLQFVEHLAAPSLVATTVGWFAYSRYLVHGQPRSPRYSVASGGCGGDEPPDPARLRVAAVVVVVVIVGFTFGYTIGAQPWMVALAALVALTWGSHDRRSPAPWRAVPWRAVPAGTAAVVLSLGVLAWAAASHLSLSYLVDGRSVYDMARESVLSAGAANVVNNLPALLVGLGASGHHVDRPLWALLVGVNMGPVVLVTGSLASLLWLATMRRLDVQVSGRDFSRFGVAVGLPAAASGLATLLLMSALGLA